MRLPSFLIALAVTVLAAPLAAQERATSEPAPSIQPLPVELAPAAAEPASLRPRRHDPVEMGFITGILVGLTVGGTYGYLTYDERCARLEGDCMLSRDVETVLFSVIGGSLGSLIGMGTTYLLDRRDRRGGTAPLTVAPDAAGALRVEVTLRH
jgi:hypothetical protein